MRSSEIAGSWRTLHDLGVGGPARVFIESLGHHQSTTGLPEGLFLRHQSVGAIGRLHGHGFGLEDLHLDEVHPAAEVVARDDGLRCEQGNRAVY